MDALETAVLRVLTGGLRTPRTLLALVLVATVGAFVYAHRTLEFSYSRQGLDDQEPWLEAAAREYHDEFPETDADQLVVVVEAPTPDAAKAYAAELIRRLETDREHVVSARYAEDTRALRRYALLYLSHADLDRLTRGLREHDELLRDVARRPGLVALLDGVNREMSHGVVSHFFTGFLDEPSDATGPLDLPRLEMLLRNVASYAKGEGTSFSSPWGAAFGGIAWPSDDDVTYWVDGKRFLLVQVRITAEHVAATAKAAAVAAVRDAVTAVRARHPDVRAGVTGGPALDVDELVSIRTDMMFASVLAFGGVLLLLVVGFRGVVRPSLSLLALNVGVVWAFAFAAATVGHLSIISAPLAPILIGLGMDDGIHVLARYEELRRVGHGVRDALERALRAVLRPLAATATSIAAALFALCLSGVRALAELGVITGTGILLVLVSTLVMLPPLVLLYDGWRERRRARVDATVRAASADPPFALPLYRHARIVLAVCGVATILGAFGLRRIGYDFDLLHLLPKGTESVDWELRLLDGGNRSAAAYGVLLADSLDEARRKVRAVETLPTVSKAISAASMIPLDQAEKLMRVHAIASVLDGIPTATAAPPRLDPARLRDLLGRIRTKLDDSATDDPATRRDLLAVRSSVSDLVTSTFDADAMARLETYQRHLADELGEAFAVLRESRDAAPLGTAQLPPALHDRFVGVGGRYLVEVFPKGDFWEPDFQARFVADLRSVDPRAVGEPVLLHASTEALKRGYARAGVLAIVALLVVLALTFANTREVALATLPLAIGSLWTVGLMALLGLRFNLGNLLTLPLMVGAGMENGIVIVSRYRERAARPFAIPRGTGLGVLLASTTTIVGFGSLIVARHRGVQSVGLLLTIAVGCVLVASLTALPAALRLVATPLAAPAVDRIRRAAGTASATLRARRLHLAGLLAGLALFAFLLHDTGVTTLSGDLHAIGWGIVALIALELAVDAINTFGWRYTLAPGDRAIGFGTLFLVRLAGTAFNQLVPAASVAGEPVKVTLLGRDVPTARAWASVITAKLSYALAQGIFVAVGLALASTRLRIPAPVAWALATSFVLLTSALLMFLALQRRGLFAALAGAAHRLRIPERWLDAMDGATAALDTAIRELHTRRPVDLVRSIGWHLSGFWIGVLQVFLLLRWLGLERDVVTCIAIESVSMLAQLALFFVPASVGVQEGGKVLAFTALALPVSAGLAVGVAFRLVQIADVAFGLAAFARLSLPRRELSVAAATSPLGRASKYRKHVDAIRDPDPDPRPGAAAR